MLHLQDWDVSAEQNLFDTYGSDYIRKLAFHLGFCDSPLGSNLPDFVWKIMITHTNMIVVIF